MLDWLVLFICMVNFYYWGYLVGRRHATQDCNDYLSAINTFDRGGRL